MEDMITTDPNGPLAWCFMLQVLGDSGLKSTLVNGNKPEDPLIIVEGTYDFLLKIELDHYPYQYPAYHLKVKDAEIADAYNLVYSSGVHHEVCVIFKSDDVPEKEQRDEFAALDHETLHLGEHKFLPGRLSVILVGTLDLDLVPIEEESDSESNISEAGKTPIFLEYWLRVLDKPQTDA